MTMDGQDKTEQADDYRSVSELGYVVVYHYCVWSKYPHSRLPRLFALLARVEFLSWN